MSTEAFAPPTPDSEKVAKQEQAEAERIPVNHIIKPEILASLEIAESRKLSDPKSPDLAIKVPLLNKE